MSKKQKASKKSQTKPVENNKAKQGSSDRSSKSGDQRRGEGKRS